MEVNDDAAIMQRIVSIVQSHITLISVAAHLPPRIPVMMTISGRTVAPANVASKTARFPEILHLEPS